MAKLALASFAAVMMFAVACGGGSPEGAPPSTPTSSNSPASTTAPSTALPPGFTESGEGGDCGDDVAIKKKCAAGLACVPKPNAPISEHTPNVCKKL